MPRKREKTKIKTEDGDLNKLSKNHLRFYQKKVKKLNQKEATADKAHEIFE